MVTYSKRIIIVREVDLSKKTLIFVCNMCVFVPSSNEIDTFPSENGETPIGVVDRRSYNNNGKPWKSSRILCGKSSKISHFSCFHFFFSFFPFHFFSRPNRRQTRKQSSRSSCCKICWPRWTMKFKMAHLRVTPLSCFLISLFHAFNPRFFSENVSSFFLVFLSDMFHCLHLYQSFTLDVSSVVGAPWRCSVLTK